MSDEPKPAAPLESNAAPRPQYEFSDDENEVFGSLATSLRASGWGVIVLIAVYHVGILSRWAITGYVVYDRFRAFYVWLPLVLILGAAVLIRAGRAFDRVATTEGSDITHLMTGLRELNAVFGWLPLMWVVLVLATVGGMIAAAVHALGY